MVAALSRPKETDIPAKTMPTTMSPRAIRSRMSLPTRTRATRKARICTRSPTRDQVSMSARDVEDLITEARTIA